MNILYYSKYCKQCLELLNKIKNDNLYDIFNRFICVDNLNNKNTKQKLPPYIVCVPTIITHEYEFPLIDKTVWQFIEWQKHKKMKKQQKEETLQYGFLAPPMTPFVSLSKESNKKERNQEMLRKFDNLKASRTIDDDIVQDYFEEIM